MANKKNFFLLEFLVFLIMGIITILEIFSFDFFYNVFSFLNSGISWFIGISFGFVFSSFLQGLVKKIKVGAIEKRKEYFSFFLINMIISLSLVALIKGLAVSFFNQFFIYFHPLFLQWLMLLYVTFKVKNNYEISAKYIFANELIILINVVAILTLVVQ